MIRFLELAVAERRAVISVSIVPRVAMVASSTIGAVAVLFISTAATGAGGGEAAWRKLSLARLAISRVRLVISREMLS